MPMNYRQAVIQDAKSHTASATDTLDLDLAEIISRIQIQMKLTNNGTTPTAHPAKAIKKISIVDGSDVLWELTGIECQALDWYTHKTSVMNILNNVDNSMCVPMMNVWFGRHLWDEELALDPRKFKNPQIKIQHDLSLGGSAPDAATLEVVADVFSGKTVSPVGWLMAKELKSYSLSSSGAEYVDLPNDYPLRMLMYQSLAAAKQPWEQYNELKLSAGLDKEVMFDNKTSDLLKYFAGPLGPMTEKLRARITTTHVYHYVTPTYECGLTGSNIGEAASYLEGDEFYGGKGYLLASANADFDILVWGYAPHGALGIPMGKLHDLNDWYDLAAAGNLRTKITAGSSVGSSSTMEVILEQLRSYAA